MGSRTPTDAPPRNDVRALLGPPAREAGVREGLSEDALVALWQATASATEARPGRRARELRTPVRIAAALGAGAAIVAVMLLAMPCRQDLALGPAALLASLLAVVFVAVLAVSLRGLHQRPLAGWQAGLTIALALGVPALLALWPGIWSTAPTRGLAPDTCYFVGLMVASIVTGATWLFQRSSRATWQRLLAAFAAGGLAAFVVLQVHCGSVEALHVLVGHAGVGVTLAALALVFLGVRRRYFGSQ